DAGSLGNSEVRALRFARRTARALRGDDLERHCLNPSSGGGNQRIAEGRWIDPLNVLDLPLIDFIEIEFEPGDRRAINELAGVLIDRFDSGLDQFGLRAAADL